MWCCEKLRPYYKLNCFVQFDDSIVQCSLCFVSTWVKIMQSLSRQACHNVTQYVEVLDPADKKERVSVFITVGKRKRQGPRLNVTGLYVTGHN